ncbi:hypothetical protein B0H19DRAFT_1155058 [Mycena capillaripes]|nr:hypothetical protein B0H19DRAFT_1155058 [Mycena capillaripes]
MTIICPDPRIALPKDVLEIVAANSSLCGRLELEITKQDLFHFNKIAVGPFPFLRSLAIRTTDDYDGQFPPLNIISRSPHLQALYLRDTVFGSPFNSEELPSSLTSLQLASQQIAQVDEVISIFEHLPHLLHFSSSYPYFPLQNLRPITAPPLRSLLLLGSPELLAVLTIPTLQHLEVIVWSETCAHLLPFLARSACQLTHLTLSVTANHIFDEALASCLAAVPRLLTLELIWAARGPELYQIMQRPVLVPDLRTLIISDIAETGYSASLAVLRARPALVHAELHIRPWHADMRARVQLPHGDVRAGFEELVRGGLSLRIMTPNGAWPQPPWGETYPDAVGNPDYDNFRGRKTRPYFFSPF